MRCQAGQVRVGDETRKEVHERANDGVRLRRDEGGEVGEGLDGIVGGCLSTTIATNDLEGTMAVRSPACADWSPGKRKPAHCSQQSCPRALRNCACRNPSPVWFKLVGGRSTASLPLLHSLSTARDD